MKNLETRNMESNQSIEKPVKVIQKPTEQKDVKSEKTPQELINYIINSPNVKTNLFKEYENLDKTYGKNLYLYVKKLKKIVNSDQYETTLEKNASNFNITEKEVKTFIEIQKKILSLFEKRAKVDYQNYKKTQQIENNLNGGQTDNFFEKTEKEIKNLIIEISSMLIPNPSLIIENSLNKETNDKTIQTKQDIKTLSNKITYLAFDIMEGIQSKSNKSIENKKTEIGSKENKEPEIGSKEWGEQLVNNAIKLIKKDKFPKDWTKYDYLIQIVENILEKSESGNAYASSKEMKKLIKDNKLGILKNLKKQLAEVKSETNKENLTKEIFNRPDIRFNLLKKYGELDKKYGKNLYLYIKKLKNIIDSDQYKTNIENNEIKDNKLRQEQLDTFIEIQKKILSFFEKRAKVDYQNYKETQQIENNLNGGQIENRLNKETNDKAIQTKQDIKTLSATITNMSVDIMQGIQNNISEQEQEQEQDIKSIMAYVNSL